MLQKLQRNQYNSIKRHPLLLFLNQSLYIRIYSILDLTFDGDIWVDNITDPTVAYAFDSRNGHFLFGAVNTNKQMLAEFVRTKIFSIIKASSYGAVLINQSDWKQINYNKDFDVITKAYEIDRQLYKITTLKPKLTQVSVPDGFEIHEVTKETLTLDLKNKPGLINELTYMWGTMDNFFKHGFGVCAMTQDSFAGWCLGEYFSSNNSEKIVGIGIETVEKFQKKGLGLAMTLSFVKTALKGGYTIYWDCQTKNIPSVRTAMKSGFELIENYKILYTHN